MKALSLWQPWASLVALGLKKVETRIWSTPYRGLIAIHSTAGIPVAWLGASRFEPEFITQLPVEWRNIVNEASSVRVGMTQLCGVLPRGVVLCTANLVDVRETLQVVDGLSDQERAFGNYDEGRYAWFFDKIKRFPHPILAKGNRRIWNWERKPEDLGLRFERMNPHTEEWEPM